MANMYDPYVYKPTNKEQLGLGLGTLISAALAASRGRNTGDALIRAAAGGLAGYGEGYKNMLDQYNDVFRRAIESKQLQNQEENMAIRNALAQENLGLKKEMFEAGKPFMGSRNTGTFNDFRTLYADKLTGIPIAEQRDLYIKEYLPHIRAAQMIGFDENDQPVFSRSGGGGSLVSTENSNIKGNIKPKIPTDTDVKFEREFTSANALLDTLEKKFEENKGILPTGAYDRIVGYPERMAKQITQIDPGLSSLNALREATLSKIIRSLGEVGTLTDLDIKRASNAMPTINDTADVRTQKFQQLKELISEINTRGRRQEKLLPGSLKVDNTNTIAMPSQSGGKSTKESALQELFELAQKGDPEAIQYFKSKGIK